MTDEDIKIIEKLFEEAENFFDKDEYKKAIECYNKIIAIDPNNASAYNNKGVALADLGKYDEAIECYDQAIEKDPQYAEAYNNKGVALTDLGQYDEAIKCYDSAIKKDPQYANAYYNKGNVFASLGRYDEAIECYESTIEIDPNHANAYNNKGASLARLRQYDEAVEYYNKTIEIDPNYENVHYNKGNALASLGQYDAAIECYDQEIEKNPLLANAYNNKGATLYKLKEWAKAGEFLGKGGASIIETISYLNEEDEKENIKTIVLNLLKYQPDNYFWKVLKRTGVCEKSEHPCQDHTVSCDDCDLINKKCEVYRKIYLESLKIIAKLQVDHPFESKVAHYTTKDAARLLLLDEGKQPSKFRLASTARANDPKEGITLFEYLYDGIQGEKNNNYRAFIGCFTFNHQSLNQFRLYGKEKGRDASGISIVVNKDFFSPSLRLTQNMEQSRLPDEKKTVIKEQTEKLSLFRCIYIDPDTNAIISLGHKELYAYIREEKDEDKDKEVSELIGKYNDYLNKYIKPKLEEVTSLFDTLKGSVLENGLNRETIDELLLMLSHLVKHVAYKEEQECRILEIASLMGEDQNQSTSSSRKVEVETGKDSYRMFIKYESITKSVDRLYMGNQFEDFGLFRDIIKHTYKTKYNMEVDSYLCNHPYASN